MSHQVKISIVIPSYNQGEFLADALDSILLQDYANYEIIVMDGGSQDGTVDVLKRYDPYIFYWQSAKDDGQSAALQAGLEMASGHYLTWLGCDDVFVENAFHTVNDYFQQKPETKWISSRYHVRLDAGGNVAWISAFSRTGRRALKYKHVEIPTPSCFFSRSLFDESAGISQTLRYTMDSELWMQFHRLGVQCHYLPKFLWGFREHSKSKTSPARSGKSKQDVQDDNRKRFLEHERLLEQYGLASLPQRRRLYKLERFLCGHYIASAWLSYKWRDISWRQLV